MLKSSRLSNVQSLPSFASTSSAWKQIHAIALKLGQINDKFVGCSAFDMYSKTGLKFEAQRLFDEMPPRNVAVWNAYISNAVLDGRPRKAIDKFIEFRRVGGEPDLITFCAFLNACADARCLDLGRQLHGLVIRSGFERDVSVANGIIDFYGKCKEVELAEMVFNGMGRRNSVSWCTMVAACEQNDEKEKACVVFLMGRKEGIELTDYMVSSVISAYAGISGLEFGRGGAVKLGNEIFESMRDRVYGKPELGKIAADNLFKLDPKDSGNHVLLSNMFAAAGRWDEATLVRKEMKEVGIKKGAGCSWVTAKNKVHVFQAKDASHERNNIRRLANFYKDIFGFEEIESPKFEFKVIWLKIYPDLAIHLIERSPDTKLPEGPYSASSPVLDPTHLPRGHHVCFSVSNFDSFVQSLKDKGIETFQRSVPNRPIRQVFFFDPDGNGLEVASRDE
ncbi:hypothetical protein D5086_019684 [Populus alba]|uniref:Uncharacterized protein n=1 Tax=Populus alba TaxID=43335 RepID=A0ACC4BHV7_POPAL